MPAYDSLDYQILKALRRDARLHASQIAADIGANERTVRKRIDRLVQNGAVRLTAVIDPGAFGYHTAVDVFLRLDPQVEEQAVARLLAMQEITYLAYGQGAPGSEAGAHDLSIQARFKDNEEMRLFLRHRLPAIPGLAITSYSLVPDILRNIDEWTPRPGDFGISPQDGHSNPTGDPTE